MPKVAPNVIVFAPEHWGEIRKFTAFYSTTYTFKSIEIRALQGVESHLEKSHILKNLSRRLIPNMNLDRQQLNKQGYSNVEHSKEVATVVEAAILELYSSVDCTAKLLRAIFLKRCRGWKDSTRFLFASYDKIEQLPPELHTILSEVIWFWKLLSLRDELTHFSTGHLSLDEKTETVNYMHTGLRTDDRALIIGDVLSWLSETQVLVNQFLGQVFHFLNSSLEQKEVFQLCGFVDGRALHRFVAPSHNLDFNSGRCGAWVWFELPENPSCPFKEKCGAYLMKAPPTDDR